MKKILFTGVGRRIELLQAFRNAALVLSKDIKIFGADMAGTAPALAYCDYTRRVVSMKDPAYIEQLVSICKDDDIDLLIPTIDTDLLILSQNKDKFEAVGTRVMVSASDKIAICRDKNNTSQFFVDYGLKAPMPVNDWREYDSGYPAFIKPKDGSSSINAFKVENSGELEVYADQVEDYIVQPFVDGREYTIDIFCDWVGNPISIVPRERLQVRAGEVLKTEICMDQTMIEESKILCKAFKPCGPMTVQLIRDNRTGEDYFIEINPRFGGGAPLSMKAGARSAESVLKLLDNDDVKYTEMIANGAIYSRFDQSVCIKEGKSKIKGVIFDLDDTLYSEKEYVRSGYKAVSEYLVKKYSGIKEISSSQYYEKFLWDCFQNGKTAIDELLCKINKLDEKEKCLGIYRSHYPNISLYQGVNELICNLKNKGIKVGIITDGRPEGQRNKLNALGLDKLIDENDIIITDELGGVQFRKPCDIAFRIMQNRWRLSFDQMIYIGDNPAKDFHASRQLGMRTLWYKNLNGLYFEHIKNEEAIESVNNIEEVINIINGMI